MQISGLVGPYIQVLGDSIGLLGQVLVLQLLVCSNLMAQDRGVGLEETFYQEVQANIDLPTTYRNVIALFSLPNETVAVTSRSVCTLKDAQWHEKLLIDSCHQALIDAEDQLWLLHDFLLQKSDGTMSIDLPEQLKGHQVNCMLWEDQTLHVGTNSGVYSLLDGEWSRIESIVDKKVNAITLDKMGRLWVASDAGLLRRKGGHWLNLDLVLMSRGTEGKYLDVQALENNDLVFSSPHSIGCISEQGNHWMYTGHDGLPYGPVTQIVASEDELWLGTDKGAIKKDDSWHYYNGKRWLPNQQVNDILILDSNTVWLATPGGISQIKKVAITLENKSEHYLDIIDQRHNRLGLINASQLEIAGDLSSSKKVSQDNDGLWTSTYLAAECFRYAVTQSATAKQNAERTFEAIERLETVTGIPGLPARSYARSADSVRKSRSPHPKVWRPSPDPDWQWLDDCSSDEVVGHMFAVSLFYDLVANEQQQESVRQLVRRTMNHIIDNDYKLIDFDGKPTRWGIWHPDSLNHSVRWAYEKGLYSLEILSFLKTAIYITGDEKFSEAYDLLIEEHNYADNAVEAKIHGPFENSHSDDILTYFPYYMLSQYARDDAHWRKYQQSIERTWAVSRPERMPTWNIIASIALGQDCDVDLARQELQLFPLDLIDWNVENSHRWDLMENQLRGRGFSRQATKPIASSEARIWRWNTNPYQLDTGAGGKKEVTGTYFLLSYWMARYHGLF